jgi:ribosomal protein S18 acetylase RimI-like enzyme
MKILTIKSKDFDMIEIIGASVLPIYYNKTDLMMMSQSKNYTLLKLQDKNEILGFVVLEHQKNNVHIFSIGIRKEYQRRGFATKIIDAIKKKYKLFTISLNVHVGNKKGIGCYKKNGFVIKKYLSNYYDCFKNNDGYYMVYSPELF